MKKQAISILFLTLCAVAAHSQELHVYYNLFNDSVAYFKDGKPVKTLSLRKGEVVQLHLTEFNPFIYDAEVKVEETIQAASGSAGLTAGNPFMSAMPGFLGGGFGGGTEGGGGGMPLLNIPILTINDNPITLASIFKSRGNASSMDMANQTMQEIAAIVETVQTAHAALKESERALRFSRFALANVERLKRQPNVKPSFIKKMCAEYYAMLFQKPLGGDISLDDLLTWQELPAKYDFLTQQLKSKNSELTAKLGLLQSLSDQITTLNLEEAEYVKYSRDLLDFLSKTKTLHTQMKDALGKTAPLGDLPSVQEIADLQLKLAEVESNNFEWHSLIQPVGDEATLVIRLLQKPDSASVGGEPKLLKERELRLESRGGLKVNASVGASFGQFFSPGQSYSVNNGVIVGEDEGSFSPSIVSFLHFHGYRGQKATLGGSFGIGFPVLASGDGQSIQFFVGPSLILGGSQKLVVTGGLMGGSVQRLAKGFKVGDPFDPFNGDIPTGGKYDLGAFFGLSFNLGN